MRGLHFILVVILLFSCDNHVGQNNTDTELFRNFNSEKFFSSIEKEAGIILDVRTEEEIALGMIEGASHIDFYDDNMFILSSRGVLAYTNNLNDGEIFYQIKNNINEFIDIRQFSKISKYDNLWFSLKDLFRSVIDNNE